MKKNIYWEELNNAIKSSFEKDNFVSKEVKLLFGKYPENGDSVSLVIIGIDNEYDQFGDGKYPANWELFLYKDGTWDIH